MRFAAGFVLGVCACVGLVAATVWRVMSLHEHAHDLTDVL